MSASEAARMLGVSRQRVSAMIRDGDLPALHPWPRAVRIPRAALLAWQGGQRPEPVHRTAARQWVLWEADASSIDELDEVSVRALCRRFIDERRSEWSAEAKREWAAKTARSLVSRS